ncbi:MAG: Flp pilus assembly complex ATPase component TadA [Deltaproteobacteria bacterium]|nr:Flp pilus assembly complex ATPase component TadA [Deltaproteobacteria bacterium]
MTFSVVINEKGGSTEHKDFDKDEITIGRVKENDIVLPKNNISKRHVRIVRKDDKFKIIDLKSTNGTYINGKRIDGPYDLREGDKIYVGDYTLELSGAEAAEEEEAPPQIKKGGMKPPPPPEQSDVAPPPASAEEGEEDWGGGPKGSDKAAAAAGGDDDDWGVKGAEPQQSGDFDLDSLLANAGGAPKQNPKSTMTIDEDAPADEQSDAHEAEAAPPPPPPPPKPKPAVKLAPPPAPEESTPEPAAAPKPAARPAPKPMAPQPTQSAVSAVNVASQAMHKRLLKSLDLRRLDLNNLDEAALRQRASQNLDELLNQMEADKQVPAGVNREELKQAVLDEALGLGPLEELLRDDDVSEIMVNGPSQIFVEKDGKLSLSDRAFVDTQAVLTVIERIVARIGRRIDESSPMVDARLPDGSRVNAIIPPISIKGPCLTIRKFTKESLTVDDLVMKTTLTPEMSDFLSVCVKYRQSIVISGGTGSGKTTTLNVLSGFIPEEERIVTIEDAAELKLTQPHIVSLETRPPNLEQRGEVTIRDLVKNALRMRPDRIVVGECRGGEALDMLQAMNTGHDGSLTTVHANSPRDAISRLETLVLMSGMELPVRAIRDQIASAVALIVQQTRFSDGSRRITHISEVTGMEGDVISMHDIFVFEQSGFDKNGKVKGQFKPTGQVPKLYEELKARGIDVDFGIFN